MVFLQLSWIYSAAVVCTFAQSDPDHFGGSDTFHAGDNSHFREACDCLGYNPDTHKDYAACMNAILYDAEQFLSHGHAELIHHLYNARTLLDEFLRESLHSTNGCESNSCVHGTCTDDGFICTCRARAREGATCNINIDECASNPCGGHGTCTDGLMEWECSCNEPYFGSECQHAVADFCVDYHQFKGITGYNDRTLSGISSVDQCWYLCLKETSFVCNSAEYIFAGRNEGLCKLSVETSYSRPDKFDDWPETHLKERCP